MRASSPDGPEALLSALATCGADPDSPAWRDLTRIMDTVARADPAVSRFWPPHVTGGHPAEPTHWRELARELHVLASRDAAARQALTEWVRHHPGAARTPSGPAPSATANVISGDSVLHGPSVQARDIHGGIHFHPSSPPPRAGLPVPRQLPPVTARFVDREDDRRALDALRARRAPHAPQVLVVSGLPGVGKTTFATHWLHEHAESFPDGQLYADLGGRATDEGDGPVSPAAVLEAFLVALGASSVPPGSAQRSALWRSMTSGLRLALLLDSAFTAAQVRPLLPGTPTGLTVVTSTSMLTGLHIDGASVHRLEGLPAESAVELLAFGGGTRVAREPTAAREVVRLCGHLPLAVALASAQLALRPHRSVSALVDSLGRRSPVETLHVEGEAVMRTALDRTYDVLPDNSRVLYRRMGLLPADRHDLALLTALAGNEEDTRDTGQAADIAVHALVEANLLQETGPGTYRFHDLVQPHARRLGEELEDADRQERTLRCFVDWCLSTAASAETLLTPSHRLPGHDLSACTVPPTPLTGPEEALAWLDTYRNGLMGAVRHSARVGWDSFCWRLVDLIWPLFLRLRPSEMWIEAHRLGLDAARRCRSRQGEGRMLTSGAIGLRNAGRYSEAADWYRQALEQAAADDDVRQQAQAVSGLGHVSLLAHRLDEARGHFEHALRLREAIGYRRGAALSRRRLGETALAGGDLATATEQLRRAGTELDSLGETYEATRVLALLGHVLDRSGDGEGGARRLREALARFRTGGTRSEHWEARCLEWLGQAAESLGDHDESIRHYEAARELFRRLNPEDAQRLDGRRRGVEETDTSACGDRPDTTQAWTTEATACNGGGAADPHRPGRTNDTPPVRPRTPTTIVVAVSRTAAARHPGRPDSSSRTRRCADSGGSGTWLTSTSAYSMSPARSGLSASTHRCTSQEGEAGSCGQGRGHVSVCRPTDEASGASRTRPGPCPARERHTTNDDRPPGSSSPGAPCHAARKHTVAHAASGSEITIRSLTPPPRGRRGSPTGSATAATGVVRRAAEGRALPARACGRRPTASVGGTDPAPKTTRRPPGRTVPDSAVVRRTPIAPPAGTPETPRARQRTAEPPVSGLTPRAGARPSATSSRL